MKRKRLDHRRRRRRRGRAAPRRSRARLLLLQEAPGTRHPRLVDDRVRPDRDRAGASAAEAAAEAEAGQAGRARPGRLAALRLRRAASPLPAEPAAPAVPERSGRSAAAICSSSRRRSPTAGRTSRTTRACSTPCRRRPAARAGVTRPAVARPRRPRSPTGSSTWPSSTSAGRGRTPATPRRERPGSNGQVVALDARTGKLRWRRVIGPSETSPLVAGRPRVRRRLDGRTSTRFDAQDRPHGLDLPNRRRGQGRVRPHRQAPVRRLLRPPPLRARTRARER